MPTGLATARRNARDLQAAIARRSPAPFPLVHLLPLALAVALAIAGTNTWHGQVAVLEWRRATAAAGETRQSGPSLAASRLSPVFAGPVQRWAPQLAAWSLSAGVDPNLAATVMQIESCGDPSARSAAGAIGLFQVMPFHFAAGEDPYDPDTNARRGLDYLRRALELAGGDPVLALAGYNGGHALIGQNPSTWPAETRRYAAWGAGLLADIQAFPASHNGLQAWLDAGGASLCHQAALHATASASTGVAFSLP
jgi:soluble lytic murein transglycosylase-like protein